MSVNPNGPEKGSSRLSPDELAQEVARHLRRGEHIDRRRRFDVVSVSRIGLILGLLLIGVGVAVAVPWVGRLAGYEAPGIVVIAAPFTACPGEPELGRLILGDGVQVVGVTEDGRFLAIRDNRGPGDVVYVDTGAVGDVVEPERLPVRACQPGSEELLVAAPATTDLSISSTTTMPGSTTPAVVEPSPTTSVHEAAPGRPPRRRTPNSGAVPPGSPPTVTTTPADPTGPTTTRPPASPPTTRPPTSGTTTTTRPTTTTTRPTTTTSTTSTTTTTTEPATTTTEPPTTTTEPTTTTTESETTTIP